MYSKTVRKKINGFSKVSQTCAYLTTEITEAKTPRPWIVCPRDLFFFFFRFLARSCAQQTWGSAGGEQELDKLARRQVEIVNVKDPMDYHRRRRRRRHRHHQHHHHHHHPPPPPHQHQHQQQHQQQLTPRVQRNCCLLWLRQVPSKWLFFHLNPKVLLWHILVLGLDILDVSAKVIRCSTEKTCQHGSDVTMPVTKNIRKLTLRGFWTSSARSLFLSEPITREAKKQQSPSIISLYFHQGQQQGSPNKHRRTPVQRFPVLPGRPSQQILRFLSVLLGTTAQAAGNELLVLVPSSSCSGCHSYSDWRWPKS